MFSIYSQHTVLNNIAKLQMKRKN